MVALRGIEDSVRRPRWLLDAYWTLVQCRRVFRRRTVKFADPIGGVARKDGGRRMSGLGRVVRGALWASIGAVVILLAGCTGRSVAA
jgi:hypothetical protein